MDVPDDLIFEEILPRVPVKSLLKLRGVAKSWKSLIDSKRFMKNHLKNSNKSSSFAHHTLFLKSFQEFKLLSLPSLFDNPLTHPITYYDALGIGFRHDYINLVGCCNGLVCILHKSENLIVWNPATRKSRKLPDPCNQLQVENKKSYTSFVKYGFGLDESNDDYKVFGIVMVFVGLNVPCRWLHIVYSLRTDTWKEIEGRDVSPSDVRSKRMGVYVGGKLHWYLIKDNGQYDHIESFDLNSHVYGVIELPSYTEGVLRSLGMVGGCLSANFVLPNGGGLDVWVMKEYGVKESWDKVVTIPLDNDPPDIPTHLAIRPTGEVLVINHSNANIQIYNPEGNVFRDPQISGFDDEDEFSFIGCSGIYVESLASVASDGEAIRK